MDEGIQSNWIIMSLIYSTISFEYGHGLLEVNSTGRPIFEVLITLSITSYLDLNAGFVSFSLSFPNFGQNGGLDNYDRTTDPNQVQALPKTSSTSTTSNPTEEVCDCYIILISGNLTYLI